MRGSTSLALGVAGAVAVFLVAASCLPNSNSSGEQAQPTASPSNYIAPVSSLPPAVSSNPATPGSSLPTPSVQSSAPTLEYVPVPTDTSSLWLQLESKQVGIIPANPAKAPEAVGVMKVASNTVVKPPEYLGCPWTSSSQMQHAGSSDPAGCNWSDTSIRVAASAYPSYPSNGTTYVYGHACQHHICPFSAIQRKAAGGYTVARGDTITIRTPSGVLTYRVTRVGSSSKNHNSLPAWANDSTVPNRVVVVTCEYESGGQSANNIVVVAKLVAAERM